MSYLVGSIAQPQSSSVLWDPHWFWEHPISLSPIINAHHSQYGHLFALLSCCLNQPLSLLDKNHLSVIRIMPFWPHNRDISSSMWSVVILEFNWVRSYTMLTHLVGCGCWLLAGVGGRLCWACQPECFHFPLLGFSFCLWLWLCQWGGGDFLKSKNSKSKEAEVASLLKALGQKFRNITSVGQGSIYAAQIQMKWK